MISTGSSTPWDTGGINTMRFVLFIVAVVVAAIVTFLYGTAKRNAAEFRYIVERCSEHVKGRVSQVQPVGQDQFRTIFTITDGEETFEIPYFRNTAVNTFVRDRDYDLYIDREVLKVAMTEEDRNSSGKSHSVRLILIVAVCFIAIFLVFFLQFYRPEYAGTAMVMVMGIIFFLAADFMEKGDTRKMEKTTYVTEARIVDYHITTDDEDGDSYFPIYRYTFGDQEYEAESDVSQRNRSEFRINQEVQIRLDPDNPQNSVIISLEKRSFKMMKLFKFIGDVQALQG